MCDTLVRVDSGRTLFAKNSDRDPNEAQLLEWHPGRHHRAGETVQCTWVTIPQVSQTHAVLLSRPFWMWGAEMGANEHGVVIGNEAVFTDQPYADLGLTGMDLVRLGLERAGSAEQATSVIIDLLETHGQGGGSGHENRSFTYHNSFLVADSREAFVLETAGQLWATERISNGARSISNGLTIAGFRHHNDRLTTHFSRCRVRQPLTQTLAAGARGPGDLMAALREHGDGAGFTPRYSLLTGGMAAPCMHAGGVAAGSQTTASWVAELRPDGCRHWVTGTAAPCTSVFVPVQVHEPIDVGAPGTDRFDPDSLWWRHEQLHRLVARDPARLLGLYAAERDALERRWLLDPPDTARAFAEADARREEWFRRVLPQAGSDRRPLHVRRYWALRDRRADISRSRPVAAS